MLLLPAGYEAGRLARLPDSPIRGGGSQLPTSGRVDSQWQTVQAGTNAHNGFNVAGRQNEVGTRLPRPLDK